MDVKRILWPTDFSGRAEWALDYVKSLTIQYGAEIHVLYVIEDLAGHKGWYGDFDRDRIDQIVEWEKKKANERLEKICSQQLEGCPLYIRHIAVGDPAREILKTIEAEGIDLVVLSTEGRQGHFRFGSVAEKVIKNASVPVVSVPRAGMPEA
jgi:nucleotide-binding universal stress UspA family protein